MTRQETPRIYELIDLIEDRKHPNAYFKEFEQTTASQNREKHKIWLAREKELQTLDQRAWDFLKDELTPYLTTRNTKGRDWEQLISILNQARAYNHLRNHGCSDIYFIPRSQKTKKRTPDLEGTVDGHPVLCEVKTINISDEEAKTRNTKAVGSTEYSLNQGFFKKLRNTLTEAKDQMISFNDKSEVNYIAFIVINFDDLFGEYKEHYYKQINNNLKDNPTPGIKVVFFNQRTCFHMPIQMSHAIIVNEAG